MRYRISEIKLDVTQKEQDLPAAVRKKLRKKNLELHDLQIVKESIDARKKPDIKRVYTVEFSCDQKLPLKEAARKTSVQWNVGRREVYQYLLRRQESEKGE